MKNKGFVVVVINLIDLGSFNQMNGRVMLKACLEGRLKVRKRAVLSHKVVLGSLLEEEVFIIAAFDLLPLVKVATGKIERGICDFRVSAFASLLA